MLCRRDDDNDDMMHLRFRTIVENIVPFQPLISSKVKRRYHADVIPSRWKIVRCKSQPEIMQGNQLLVRRPGRGVVAEGLGGWDGREAVVKNWEGSR